MFHIEDPQISGTTIQNLVSQATWHLEFVHPCYMWCRLADLPTVDHSNHRIWVSPSMFTDWFISNFSSNVVMTLVLKLRICW